MTKYELAKYQAILSEIRQLEEEIDEMESPVTGMHGKIISDMPSAPKVKADRIGDVIADTEHLKNILKMKRRKLIKQRIKIEHAIESLEPVERTICRYRQYKQSG